QPEEPKEPFVMPSRVSLPLKVSMPLDIARLQVETVDGDGVASSVVIDELAARYVFDARQHVLDLDSFRYGQSRLQARAQLDARTLAISAQLAASLRDLVPDTPLAMLARLQA